MSTIPPHLRLRARGATSNAAGRFERQQRESFDDGWDMAEDERPATTDIRLEVPRSALVWNSSPDLFFDRSINPYRGCEHGCIYCFARPTHAYLGLSPGLDFETRLIARPGIGAVLDRELRRKGYSPAPIGIGTNTDPYQPCERDHRVMREVMEVLAAFRHPVGITTKGTLVERDLDLLAPMAAQGLVGVGISMTTLDPGLSRRLEPRAPAPARRLETIRRLTAAGVPVRAMIAPVIPGLTDHELEPLLQAARDAGARNASYIGLRLPMEVAGLFRDWLATHEPGKAAHVMGRVREWHGGKDYDANFGIRMKGQGIWSDLLSRRFATATRRLGLTAPPAKFRNDLFRPPPRAGDQLGLFDAP
ncbi:PA0069 family radical SAM protein [Gemmobacter sp.]|uniref:PA0069 family radical SAM protein n=1 Tax=Gemmobacter sp. TaxID=1898957 RepID=UPI002AFFE7EB|nr:PA0069 family radical SAM protein [Gemmobacter sp.]